MLRNGFRRIRIKFLVVSGIDLWHHQATTVTVSAEENITFVILDLKIQN